MSHFSIAALQLELSNQDNLYLIQREIEAIAARFPWLDMVVVGELATFGTSPARAQPMGGEAEQMYCELAQKLGIWLLPGSLLLQVGADTHNTALVINPQGEVVLRYHKMFPFMPYEKGTKPGVEFPVFDVPDVGRMAVCICYDQWVPELIRSLVCQGAELIFCPTLTNTIDRDVELSIARANAAIHQCYFLSINVAGKLGLGRSVVIGPEGDVIHQAGSGHEVITIDADLGRVRRVRERGTQGLVQSLKSFRDAPAVFPAYTENANAYSALSDLGELKMPERGT
ncbi:MAG: carbon-nitrogen hydrolase family protein [Halieaceae bacterium]|jgi:deaminated glutathione amidase|nr:carbon-nitrogen hydrolase family protein [Halieaceae bacterium]